MLKRARMAAAAFRMRAVLLLSLVFLSGVSAQYGRGRGGGRGGMGGYQGHGGGGYQQQASALRRVCCRPRFRTLPSAFYPTSLCHPCVIASQLAMMRVLAPHACPFHADPPPVPAFVCDRPPPMLWLAPAVWAATWRTASASSFSLIRTVRALPAEALHPLRGSVYATKHIDVTNGRSGPRVATTSPTLPHLDTRLATRALI